MTVGGPDYDHGTRDESAYAIIYNRSAERSSLIEKLEGPEGLSDDVQSRSALAYVEHITT